MFFIVKFINVTGQQITPCLNHLAGYPSWTGRSFVAPNALNTGCVIKHKNYCFIHCIKSFSFISKYPCQSSPFCQESPNVLTNSVLTTAIIPPSMRKGKKQMPVNNLSVYFIVRNFYDFITAHLRYVPINGVP